MLGCERVYLTFSLIFGDAIAGLDLAHQLITLASGFSDIIVGQIARALNVAPGAVTPAVINGFATNPATRPILGAITGAAVNPAVTPLLALQPLQFIPPFLGVPG